MSHLFSAQPNKPNRLDSSKYPNKDTNKDYHVDYAMWAVTNAHNHQHSEWLNRIRNNKRFYKGDQWETREDKEAFLKDSSGQTTNRIKIVHNLIRPMVEQFRGNAIRLSINATAKSVSPRSISRKDKQLEELLFKTEVANEFPGIGAIIRDNSKEIGEDEAETTTIFNNLYVDMYLRDMNNLLKYVAKLNDFKEMQPMMAIHLSLTGLICVEAFEHGGHQRYKVMEPEDFWWDRDARRYDLTDANYMGTVEPMDPSAIFEMWQNIPMADRTSIENYVSSQTSGSENRYEHNSRSFNSTKLPVYKAYWRDIDHFQYGWVMTDLNIPQLVKINHTEPGQEEPKWTKKDLIDPPNTPMSRSLFKGKSKVRNLYVDVLRYCVFIPGDVVAAGSNKNEDKVADIALEFGTHAYQETDYLDLSNVKFPFKCAVWGYIDGEVFSPVDDAINPQRFINRVLSVTESQINNAGGSNVIIDEDTIAGQDKGEIYRDIKQGNPVSIRTKGRGVPNSVGFYDATSKKGTYDMFQLIPIMKGLIQDTTGINEGLKGESTGPDQLVGVTQLLIQKGSLMQEAFYDAIAKVHVQMYQHTATVGKRMYIDNEMELSLAVGDIGAEVIKLSKDCKNEDFRVFIERDNNSEAMQTQADQLLGFFLENQIIDQVTFTDLYGRSTPDEVMFELRQRMRQKMEADRRAAKQQNQEQQQAAQQEQQMMAQAQQQEAQSKQEAFQMDANNKEHDLNKIITQGAVDSARDEENREAPE
ncbi:MAG: hypothetical protein COA88_14635 [Kordia sp.]|jgi:hypothetical protein|nr:MAG: hypothetical protein COA88_14635 [Kordia sp.]